MPTDEMNQPSFEELRDFYCEWFKENYGIKPVATSSTGYPAVAFAQAALNRYGASQEGANA